MAELLRRVELDLADLWKTHPPIIRHAQKRLILDRAARAPSGSLTVSRWAPSAVPSVGAAVSIVEVAGPFSYPRPEPGVTSWHVNFADPDLFAFYGSGCFAQDEIQVAEHPLLACVREHLLDQKDPALRALTHEPERPTPVLVKNVPRWCAINASGIYGRALSSATDDAVSRAVTRLDDAPPSHILAIVAPQGTGLYTRAQLEDILVTAVTGFAAARAESGSDRLRIHTGHWGTGAFGGDRVLMAAAQVLAARMVGVDELAYHSLTPDAEDAFRRGLGIASAIPNGTTLASVVDLLAERAFVWGSSDGN